MNKIPTRGILAALAVPFDGHGQIKPELESHIKWLKKQGIHGIFVNGSTGQFPALTVKERERAMESVAGLADPLPVIANISDLDPRVISRLGRSAALIGVSAVAIMPQDFYPAKAADHLERFRLAADSAGLPVMLYNFPELTGNRIGTETIRAFARSAPLMGIKQSGQEFDYHTELIELGKELGFVVFSGSDTRLPEVFEMGAAGCIGGLVNFVADLMVDQYRICVLGEAGDLDLTVDRMRVVGELMSREASPGNISAGMRARGFDPGVGNLLFSKETRDNLHALTIELRGKFDEWGLAPG